MFEEKIRRLSEWAMGGKAPPYLIDINPTDKCNLKCLTCWQRSKKFKSIDSSYELSDDKLISVVKEALDFGVKEFEITGGGEPLVRKEATLKIMRIIKDFGKPGNITTNGTLFDEDVIKLLVKIGWDRVTFSIDGPNPEINDYLRGKGSFEKIVQNIKILNRVKKSFKKKKPSTKFNVVVSRKNYNVLDGIVKLAHSLGCEMISFEPMTVHSSIGMKLSLRKSETKELRDSVRRIERLANELGIITNIQNFIFDELMMKPRHLKFLKQSSSAYDGFASSLCFEPWWHLVIKVDGSAQPCCLFDSKEENVKDKSLREIWFGKFFNDIRENMTKKKFSGFCLVCNAGQVAENIKIREEFEIMKNNYHFFEKGTSMF
ncbi:MAG: radical SAM protein [Candidatus Aenigmarchaeota archaeon]|nr:radical SAM protein [Candidatus Aenigmarchaeota archaeon]